jgi:hypothetical protein
MTSCTLIFAAVSAQFFKALNGGPQIALGQVVVGRDPSALSPVIEALDVGPEDLFPTTTCMP